MFVVWAKGQQQGAYTHVAESALDDGNHSNIQFYPDDILKYHGAKNRGVHPIDFTTPVKMLRPGDAAFGVNIAATQQPVHKDIAKISDISSTTLPPDTLLTSDQVPYEESSSNIRDITILSFLIAALFVLY
ncbi:unnamed protein product [Cylicostephanus goldi]|uniref:DOMON domain-containing protein n=1 Tax=Cylicostephanus goldi TaxID=71465 RepID=A0A3P7MEM1_CYLGO|nr:unnamed protein product [Cylicostephanus goldi]